MTTYIMLANWTEQGVRNVKKSPRRLDMAKSLLEEIGGEFKSFFMTMGDYDFVAVYEAPDDAMSRRRGDFLTLRAPWWTAPLG